MRHIVIQQRGSAIHLRDNLCVVEADGETVLQEPLSRIASITVAKSASITSDFILACAARCIQVHFIGWNGMSAAAIDGLHTHAVVALRKRQFETIADGQAAFAIAKRLVAGKIANQRAVLLYFSKHHGGDALPSGASALRGVIEEIGELAYSPLCDNRTGWRFDLLGLEGKAAGIYWRALRDSSLLGGTFESREGRGSTEVANQALNYGYAVLGARVWQCVVKTGLEPYAGLLHTDRPGKASLVLDFIELFRAWVVDRCVIKMRGSLDAAGLGQTGKRRILDEIFATLKARQTFHGKRLQVETIIQRQVYSLCGSIAKGSPFRPYTFKW